jgi:hypothetical protein
VDIDEAIWHKENTEFQKPEISQGYDAGRREHIGRKGCGSIARGKCLILEESDAFKRFLFQSVSNVSGVTLLKQSGMIFRVVDWCH